MAKRRQARAPLPQPRLDGSAGVYMFFGPERWLRGQRLAELIARAVGGQEQAQMAVSEFEGPSATLGEVLDELRTLPFLAERRVVIVADADSFISEHRDALERYADAPVATGVLALLADAVKSNSRLFKAVAARGGAVRCDMLSAGELNRWVRERAGQEHGRQIDEYTAGLLLDLVGDELARLDSELAKLATYLGTRTTITPDDVDELVANRRLHDAWELAGAIGARDAPAALARWHDMLTKEPGSPYRAVGLIAWQLRQFLRARLMRRQGMSRAEVLRQLRMPGYARDRFVEQVSRFSDARLRRLLGELVSVDLSAKTGGAPADRGIERFIVQACGA